MDNQEVVITLRRDDSARATLASRQTLCEASRTCNIGRSDAVSSRRSVRTTLATDEFTESVEELWKAEEEEQGEAERGASAP